MTKHKVIVGVFLSKQFFQFIDLLLSFGKHQGNRLWKKHLTDTRFGFRRFQDKFSRTFGEHMWESEDNVPAVKSFDGLPTDSLQFLVDINRAVSVLNALFAYINAIPSQCQHFTHSQ